MMRWLKSAGLFLLHVTLHAVVESLIVSLVLG